MIAPTRRRWMALCMALGISYLAVNLTKIFKHLDIKIDVIIGASSNLPHTSSDFYPFSNPLSRTTSRHPSYPLEYTPSSLDSAECQASFSPKYLEHTASHHVPYCERQSRSSMECFRTHNDGHFCLATGVLLAPKHAGADQTAAMHCRLRNFTRERLESPRKELELRNVVDVNSMRSGFFETGVMEQLKHWNISAGDENMMVSRERRSCDFRSSDKKWTLLVKREGRSNLWHMLMEIWQATITLDVLQMAINPITGRPYLTPNDIANMQVIFAPGDAGIHGAVDEMWTMVTGHRPILQEDIDTTCLGNVILPLEGSTSPFWNSVWEPQDCHDRFLINAFLQRVHRHFGIKATQGSPQSPENPVVTVIERKHKRKIRNLEHLVSRAKARWPEATFQLIDLATLSLKEQITLMLSTSVLVGMHGAGLTNLLFLPASASIAEIQPPNRRTPESPPFAGFRNLAVTKGLQYFTAHPESRLDDDGAGNWRDGEWVDVQEGVFLALVDAAVNSQLNRGVGIGEVLPRD
ncbi:hypothetical protein BP6252_09051 [Coleophoma cylindrospora]|uniref:EGF domain-specific O-linked N-acetylglucosamine transferase n=1 Tax=Coleophoma cylindrospora TaxID=1849047 RepID=A0A3D8R0W0_9HELO|nr:hypothetical protein BP6252_09051 [Coleophoma cylindrospora]